MNKSDEAQLVALLTQLEPGFLPYEVFLQIARLATLSIVEFVPLRWRDGRVEVLLLPRDPRYEHNPGELHTPGTVIRPTDIDSDEHLAFKRIQDEELQGIETSDPIFVGSNLHRSWRGAEHAQIFWVEVLSEPGVGEFYPIDELPAKLMDSQLGFIKLAADNFKSATQSQK